MSFEMIQRCWNTISSIVRPLLHREEDESKFTLPDGNNVIFLCPEIRTPAKFAYKRPVNWQSAEATRVVCQNQTVSVPVSVSEDSTPLRTAYNLRSRRCPCCFDKPTPYYRLRETTPRKKLNKINKKKTKSSKQQIKINKKKECYLQLLNEHNNNELLKSNT